MGTLYLVRHGQASFGADDYDQLSELGHRQSRRLGEHFSRQGLQFDACMSGTLRRQQQTLQGIVRGMDSTVAPASWEGLNEYDSLAVIAAIHPEPLAKPDTPEIYRQHFRLLRRGLAAWMAGTTQPQGMPTWAAFSKGVADALDHVRQNHHGKNVLLVSSGGPIATAVSQVLGVPPNATIELNLRIRNTAVTEFAFTPKRHTLVIFNALPHLDVRDHADWVTYA